MTQQIINIGTGPDTGTGAPLRTAFSQVNANFTECYSDFAFLGASASASAAQTIIDNAASDGRIVMLAGGTHPPRGTLQIPRFMTVFGAGMGRTILTPDASGNHVFKIDETSHYTPGVTMGGFTITGSQVGSGHGIYIPAGTSIHNLRLFDMQISAMGGCAIKDAAGAFTANISNIIATDNLDHQFDFLGANTFQMENCYAQVLPTAGTAGYRIRGSTPLLLSCNGINRRNGDSGQIWGWFNSRIADGDPIDTYGNPTLINCNIEDFGLCGLRNKNGSFNRINSPITAYSSGTVRAIDLGNVTQAGFADAGSTIGTAGASWENSQAIHTEQGQAPFISPDDYAYYVSAFAYTANYYGQNTANVEYGKFALSAKRFRTEDAHYIGTAGAAIYSNAGSPESVVTATPGSYCADSTNGEGYIKHTGTGNTGWKLVTHA